MTAETHGKGLIMLIAEIKRRLNIKEIAEEEGLILIKQSNNIFKALCCFHREKKPSLTFYEKTNSYKCYACQEAGDLINFYAKRHNISNEEAIKNLAGRLLISQHREVKKNPGPARKEPIQDLGRDKAKGFSAIYQDLMQFCGGLDYESLNYLTGPKRLLTPAILRHFKLFSIKDYKKVKDYLLNNYGPERLREAVLIDNKGRFIFTKNKIIIPIIEEGRIIALRGRFLDCGNDTPRPLNNGFIWPKYKSTGGVSGRLFNSDLLKRIKPGVRVYLCEGEFDTMLLNQKGYNAVGLLGVSNYTEETIKRLVDYEVILTLDNDIRGREEAQKIRHIILKSGGKDIILEDLQIGRAHV